MNVLIIGGSSDIGINLAKKFRDHHHHVMITYNSNPVVIDNVLVEKCNVLIEEDIESIIKKCNDIFINDYILINLAAICMDNSFLNKTKKEFMKVLEVNLVGMFLCNQIYSRYISNGLIINMSSTDGLDTYSEYSLDYSISKAGIINMSKNIGNFSSNKVICLCPNWIDSNSTRSMNNNYLNEELKRIGQNRLITMDEIVNSIYEITVNRYKNININKDTEIIRIDVRNDKLWIEKM